jgi:cellulose synthase A
METQRINANHDEPVVCCRLSEARNMVMSGCEASGLHFTDLDANKSIGTFNFNEIKIDGPVSSIELSRQNDNVLYTSVGTHIYQLDIRLGTSKESIMGRYEDITDEEINSISLSDDETRLAAGDDSGEIHIVDVSSGTSSNSTNINAHRILRRGHTNICSSVIYRKKNKNQLLSGGLDCQLIRWDPQRLKMVAKWTMPSVTASGPKAINPPMIHSLDTTLIDETKREIVAVARGDGCIALYDADVGGAESSASQKKSKQSSANKSRPSGAQGLLWMAMEDDSCHNAPANSVSFTRVDNSTLLLSGGNDARLLLWDWTNQDAPLLQQLHNGPHGKINCVQGVEHAIKSSHIIGLYGDVLGSVYSVSNVM